VLSSQVARYVIVGGLGTATHLAILTVCVEWGGLDPILGTIAGFLGALSVSYVLNHCWTFQSRRPHLSSLWRYVTVSLTGLMLNTGMMYVLVSLLHWWYLTAQLSVILIVPVSNFLMNRYWTFSFNPEQCTLKKYPPSSPGKNNTHGQ
jgi:putative flippase GtrA